MERIGLGSAEATEDEEVVSALRSADLRFDPVSILCIVRLSPRFGFARSHNTLIHAFTRCSVCFCY